MTSIRPVPDRAFAEWAGSALVAAIVVATSGFGLVEIPGPEPVLLGAVVLGAVVLTAVLGVVVRRCGSIRFTAEDVVITQAWWPPRRVRWGEVTGADLVEGTDQEGPGATFRTLVLRRRGTTGRSLKVPVRFPLDPSAPESAAAALCRRELADRGIRLRS